jgi:hypothetical protein
MSNRASIFTPREELDISGFKPKAASEQRPDPAQIDEVRSARFRSREAVQESPPEVTPQPTVTQQLPAGQPEIVSQPTTVGQQSTKRQPLVYRTGRNTTFSVKTTPETVEAFYEIARAQNWKAGETFERALAALRRELAG